MSNWRTEEKASRQLQQKMGHICKGTIKRDINAPTARCLRIWRNMLRALIRRRIFADVGSPLLYTAYENYKEAKFNRRASQLHRELIATTNFEEVFMNMGDEDCLRNLRFSRSYRTQIVTVVTGRSHKYRKERKMYKKTTVLSTGVVIKRRTTTER